jgi:acetyltransferase-like isoleucine patch superfamily enzyme
VVLRAAVDGHTVHTAALDEPQLALLSRGESVTIEHVLVHDATTGDRAYTMELLSSDASGEQDDAAAALPAAVLATLRFQVRWELSFQAARLYDLYSLDSTGFNAGVVHLLTVGRGTYGLYPADFSIRSDYQWHINVGSFCSFWTGTRVDLVRSCAHRKRAVSTYPDHSHLADAFPNGVTGVPAANEVRTFTIGHDVWVGQNVVFINECDVGTGAVIGAESVVRGLIPPYAIAIGNPAVVVGFRFDNATVDALLASHWWELPDEKVAEMLALDDAREFLAQLEGERASNSESGSFGATEVAAETREGRQTSPLSPFPEARVPAANAHGGEADSGLQKFQNIPNIAELR